MQDVQAEMNGMFSIACFRSVYVLRAQVLMLFCLTLFFVWPQHSFHDARASRQHGTPGLYARTRRETLRRSIAKGEVGA